MDNFDKKIYLYFMGNEPSSASTFSSILQNCFKNETQLKKYLIFYRSEFFKILDFFSSLSFFSQFFV
jgi:hypothetical protein